MQERTLSYNVTTKSFLLMFAAAGCLLTAAMTIVLAGSGWKTKAGVFFVVMLPIVARFVGSMKDVLLFCWVGSQTYNRQFFSFDALLGQGPMGFYWVLADLPFIALLAIWLYEAVQGNRVGRVSRPAPALWPWFLPYAGIALLSIVVAERPDWTIIELMRYVRFGLILWYVSHNVGVRQWWVIVIALGCATAAQSAIAVKEIVTGKSGVFGSAGLDEQMAALAANFDQESFYGSVRGTGTMNHPPNLASYLTLVVPAILGLTLTLKNVQLRLISALFFLAGAAGLAATLSRVPWVMAGMAIVLVFLILAMFRDISLKQSLGCLVMGAFILCLCLIPVRDKLMRRITGDLSASMDQRADGLKAAMTVIAEENPIIGIGLNNTRLFVERFLPDISWIDETDQLLVAMNMRSISTLGNAFSYVAVETGILGFMTFTVLIIGTFVIGWRAVCRTTGPARGVSLGLTLGWLGVLGGQVVDHSIFVDPVMYTMAIVFALLNLTPTLFGNGNSQKKAGQT
jgi:hypothetical protein